MPRVEPFGVLRLLERRLADIGMAHTLSQVLVTVGEETGCLTTQRLNLSSALIGGTWASLRLVAYSTLLS